MRVESGLSQMRGRYGHVEIVRSDLTTCRWAPSVEAVTPATCDHAPTDAARQEQPTTVRVWRPQAPASYLGSGARLSRLARSVAGATARVLEIMQVSQAR